MTPSFETNILRNTATLQAWRAYNRKANAPLTFFILPLAMTGAVTPAATALVRHHHPWLSLALFMTWVILCLVGLAIAAVRVRAYKRDHPFVPPPPPIWGQPPPPKA
jgi:hypothetical protein